MSSRVLKFRAFDKFMKTTHEVLELDFKQKRVYVNYQNAFHNWLSFRDVELHQYTGLSDLNGQPVYEGDILTNTAQRRSYVVTYSQESASFVAHALLNENSPALLTELIVSGFVVKPVTNIDC